MRVNDYLIVVVCILLFAPGCAPAAEDRPSVCGNNICESSEDGLSCPADCRFQYCGNGIVEPGEECDGGDLGGKSCASFGFNSGTLRCSENCRNDTSNCKLVQVCGDSICSPGESQTSCPGDCGACESLPCDLIPQCGCTTGTKCTLEQGERVCSTAGSSGHGVPCQVDSECSVGTHCVGANDESKMCLAFCATDDDCSGGDAALCAFALEEDGIAILDAAVCSTPCDPTNPAQDCETGWACELYRVDSGSSVASLCIHNVGASVSTCDENSIFCAPGFTCVSGTCLKWCKVNSADCPSGTTCSPFTPSAVLGSTEYGICKDDTPECGDGTVQMGEECDDANTTSGDGCSAGCLWENTCAATPTVSCGVVTSDNMVGQTDDLNNYACNLPGMQPERVYSFTANQTGTVDVLLDCDDANGDDYDLLILEDTCNSGTCIDVSYNVGDDSITVSTVAGHTYFIVIEAYSGTGVFNLEINCSWSI